LLAQLNSYFRGHKSPDTKGPPIFLNVCSAGLMSCQACAPMSAPQPYSFGTFSGGLPPMPAMNFQSAATPVAGNPAGYPAQWGAAGAYGGVSSFAGGAFSASVPAAQSLGTPRFMAASYPASPHCVPVLLKYYRHFLSDIFFRSQPTTYPYMDPPYKGLGGQTVRGQSHIGGGVRPRTSGQFCARCCC